MNFLRDMALAMVVMAAVGSGAQAQDANPSADAPSAKPEKFKDWDLFCSEAKANAPRVCEIRTVIVAKDGQHLGALAVASLPAPSGESAQVIASALVPLGVDLTAEPRLAVGEAKPVSLKFLRCLKRGCEAATPLSDDQQAAMRAGSVAKGAVGIGGEKTATLEFSLSGFSAAHDAMKSRTAAQ